MMKLPPCCVEMSMSCFLAVVVNNLGGYIHCTVRIRDPACGLSSYRGLSHLRE